MSTCESEAPRWDAPLEGKLGWGGWMLHQKLVLPAHSGRGIVTDATDSLPTVWDPRSLTPSSS